MCELLILCSQMQSQQVQRPIYSKNLKKKNFRIRKVASRDIHNPKYLKGDFSNPEEKEQQGELASNRESVTASHNRKGEMLGLTAASEAFKKMIGQYLALKNKRKHEKYPNQKHKQGQHELTHYHTDDFSLQIQPKQLHPRKRQINPKIKQLRQRQYIMRMQWIQRNKQKQRMADKQQQNNMSIAMQYQNGIDIDPDNMTYEELLQLEEQIGNVSKGISAEQFKKIPVIEANGSEEVCSVCCQNLTAGEKVSQLPCQHCYHIDCIKEWLLQERVCPLCKHEIIRQPCTNQQSQ